MSGNGSTPGSVLFLAENLRADDFTVVTAASGGEVIDALEAARPDDVLLDVVLTDMSSAGPGVSVDVKDAVHYRHVAEAWALGRRINRFDASELVIELKGCVLSS